MPSRSVLDPLERASEVVFGLLMVMTFTGSLSVATAGREEIRSVLVAAIACNVAWGLVDGAMYLIANFAQRARGEATLATIRRTADATAAHLVIRDALPAGLSSILTDAELEVLRQRVHATLEPRVALSVRDDLIGAAAVFLLVFLSTLPVVIPFVVMTEATPALRISHAIAISMLFVAGWSVGAHAGRPPWRSGLVMVAVGLTLAAITRALGG